MTFCANLFHYSDELNFLLLFFKTEVVARQNYSSHLSSSIYSLELYHHIGKARERQKKRGVAEERQKERERVYKTQREA